MGGLGPSQYSAGQNHARVLDPNPHALEHPLQSPCLHCAGGEGDGVRLGVAGDVLLLVELGRGLRVTLLVGRGDLLRVGVPLLVLVMVLVSLAGAAEGRALGDALAGRDRTYSSATPLEGKDSYRLRLTTGGR